MRILVATGGSFGDVLPFLGIARALAARGHDVVFFANGHFATIVRQCGIPFVAVGGNDEYLDIVGDARLMHPRLGIRLLAESVPRFTERAYDALDAHVLPGSTLIVASTLAIAARLVQETRGVPAVVVHLAPFVFRSAVSPPRLHAYGIPRWMPPALTRAIWRMTDRWFLDPLFCPAFNRLRANLGLRPVGRLFDDWIHTTPLVIGLFPAWFASPQPDWPSQVRLTGFALYDLGADHALPAPLRDFLDAGDAPLVFTPGTACANAHWFFTEAAAVCKALGRRGIFVTRFPRQLPATLPDGVCHVAHAPFSRLLPHARALVHHGGIGTTSHALRAGIPQIVRPMAFDQFDNASRVHALGVATEVRGQRARPRRVASALETLLGSDPTLDACTRAARYLDASDPLAETCDLIVSAAGAGQASLHGT